MHSIHFNALGNIVAALFFFTLPLVIIIIGAWARRKGFDQTRWLIAKRYWYLPILIPFALYYAVIYRWLFYDQFYWVTIKNDGTWQLEYYLPPRTVTITEDDISDIQIAAGDIWTYRDVRILILTKDGKRYLSTQVSASDRDYYIILLTKYKNEQ